MYNVQNIRVGNLNLYNYYTYRLAPFSGGRRKDYTPVSWKNYYEKYVDVDTEEGVFRVYLSPEPDHPQRPRIVALHGGGYSALSWSLFTVGTALLRSICFELIVLHFDFAFSLLLYFFTFKETLHAE